ncbi:hypothetical protein JCM8208_002459 [Rhodotorula glutinis]
MSVFSANSFALLGDGDDSAPAAAPAKAAPAAAAPAAAPKAAPKQQRDAAPRQQRQPRTGGDREVNASVPAGEDAKEDRAKSFARGGGRGGRGGVARGPGANPRGNGGTYLGGNRPRRDNGGGRPFDRHSQTGRVDSDKAEAAGWGAEDGKKELEAEQLGDADAKAEKPTAAADGTATPVREAPIEEEDNTQTYEEYLAAQAEKKLSLALPEARKANEGDDASFGQALTKKAEAEEEWLYGAPKAAAGKTKKQKEGKTFIEVEFTSAPRKDTRGERAPAARGRGGARGRGEGRGRGGARGGATRGAPSSRGSAPAVPDASAFPALA